MRCRFKEGKDNDLSIYLYLPMLRKEDFSFHRSYEQPLVYIAHSLIPCQSPENPWTQAHVCRPTHSQATFPFISHTNYIVINESTKLEDSGIQRCVCRNVLLLLLLWITIIIVYNYTIQTHNNNIIIIIINKCVCACGLTSYVQSIQLSMRMLIASSIQWQNTNTKKKITLVGEC